jgi:hypothetical protein
MYDVGGLHGDAGLCDRPDLRDTHLCRKVSVVPERYAVFQMGKTRRRPKVDELLNR